MKRRIMLLAGILAISLLSFAQQRLAVLPASMRLTEDGVKLSSLCIDLLRDPPSGEMYGEIGPHFIKNYTASGPSGLHKPGDKLPERMFLTGAENEPIPQSYSDFLHPTIESYRSGFNTTKYHELQNEIWAYNGMDELGEIDRSAIDQVAEFKAKSKEFAYKYDIEGETDAQTHRRIADKAKQLDKLGYPFPSIASTDEQFSEAGISFSAEGQKHQVEVHYAEGTDFASIEQPYYINKKLDQFQSAYGVFPEEASISKSDVPQRYTLTFIAEGNWRGPFHMNFLIENNKSAFQEHELPGTTGTEVCIQPK